MSGAPPGDAPPQTPPPKPPPKPEAEEEKTVGELFLEVSEQATVLIREEIELAKAEITEKLNRLLTGSVVGIVAGVFLLLALFLIMNGVAFLLGDNVFDGRVWLGYLVEAAAFLLIAGGAGFYAYRSLRRGAPPTPRHGDRAGEGDSCNARSIGASEVSQEAVSGAVSPELAAGNGIASVPPPGSRSPDQIRDDIVRRRTQLGHSVDSLRGRVNELTDWRGQVRKHRTELLVGAAAVGLLAGGAAYMSWRSRNR
jgi:hypothetical protein